MFRVRKGYEQRASAVGRLLIIAVALAVAVGAIFQALPSFAQSSADSVVTRMEQEVPQLLQTYGVPGAAITYLEDGRIAYSNGFGVTNTLLPGPVTPDTVFQVGSLSKSVAAYICLKLARDGKLDLDRPVASYVSEPWISAGDWAQAITVRQLLAHTSGLTNAVETMDKTIAFAPGTRYSYAGVGYIYLMKIIEQVTGRPFDEVARDYAFRPLGMRASTFVLPAVMPAQAASPHLQLSQALIYCLGPFVACAILVYLLGLVPGLITRFRHYTHATLLKVSVGVGFAAAAGLVLVFPLTAKLFIPTVLAGVLFGLVLWLLARLWKRFWLALLLTAVAVLAAGLLPVQAPLDITPGGTNAAYSLTTSAADLGAFAAELLAVAREPEEPLASMFSEQVTIDAQRAWGLGIGIQKDAAGVAHWHSGINPGSRALLVLDLEHQNGIVILTNSDTGLGFADAVVAIALGRHGTWDVR